MDKRVELSEAAYQSLLRHPFITEERITSWVLQTPESERNYTDEEHFDIRPRTRKGCHVLEILILVHEQSITYLVYGIHTINLK